MYVIQRNDGAFVTPPGQEKSYTRAIQDAWVFRSREDAQRETCAENECVVSLDSLLKIDGASWNK